MLYKKSQIGVKELIMTLVLAGVIAIIGVLIFSNVSNVSKDIFPKDEKSKDNESVTITVDSVADDNSTLLANKGFIENSETVRNGSAPYKLLNRNTEYKITLTGTSGDLETRANFTLLNVTNGTGGTGEMKTYNNTALLVTYSYNAKNPAQTSAEKVDDTTLDSFELGVVALIVLAAVVVLATVISLNK